MKICIYFCVCLIFIEGIGFAGKLRERQISIIQTPTSDINIALDGKKLYNKYLCYSCHGKNENSSVLAKYPRIYGQNFKYLSQQIKDIKNSKRNNALSQTMQPFVVKLTNEEIMKISYYLSSFSFSSNHNELHTFNSISMGKKLYKKYMCHVCHGPKGKYPTSNIYPKLIGQNTTYLKQQLLDIKYKKRINSISNSMLPFISDIDDNELLEIANYLSSLKE